MLHRAVIGSLERFIGILIENCAGVLPPWLAPIQAVVIPVAPPFAEYADTVRKELDTMGFRVIADTGTDRMNAKIRKYQEEKVMYQLIVGQHETDSHSVAVRMRKGGQKIMTVEEFGNFLQAKIVSFSQDAE